MKDLTGVIDDQERIYRIALTLVEGLGVKKCLELFERFKSAAEVYEASVAELEHVNIPEKSITEIINRNHFDRAELELDYISRNGIRMVSLGEKDYPPQLNGLSDAPFLFFYKGEYVLQHERIVSIVGTRNASSYGRRVCQELVSQLVPYQPVILSGLAYGIDCYAHQAALDNNLPTVGVLGHSLDRIYPAAHTKLAQKMLDSGGLVSEFVSGTVPDRFNFPMRNRIIAGLAHITILAEAGDKGGALITANIAESYDRDVGAVPGGIFDEFSAGCNRLIRTNHAAIIRSGEDIAEALEWEQIEEFSGTIKSKKRIHEANPQESVINEFLHHNGPANMDRLAEGTGINLSSLSLILLQMEMKEMITALPGKIYKIA